METVHIAIVEDSDEFSAALKGVLEEQNLFPCKVHVLNPSDKQKYSKPPTMEEFYDEIVAATTKAGCYSIVLLDNYLGDWKWKGANLAPSLSNVVSISSDPVRWASFSFPDKANIAWRRNDDKAKRQFLATLVEILKKILPPEETQELVKACAAQ